MFSPLGPANRGAYPVVIQVGDLIMTVIFSTAELESASGRNIESERATYLLRARQQFELHLNHCQ